MSTHYHNSFFAMGTRCHLILPNMEQGRSERIFATIKQEVNRVETYLSRFIAYSEISVINKNAGKEPVKVNSEIFNVLRTCMNYCKMTEGAFDITLRPLLQYWKNKQGDTQADEHLDELMKIIGSKQIELNEEEQTVFLKNERVEIDLGGFGKGYGLEVVHKLLKSFAVKNAFLSFGESSILTLGSHPAGDHWKIGLNDYTRPGESAYTFSINEGSVSTSSNFYVDDHGNLKNNRHIISPFSGYPVEDIVTVSVRSDSAVTAEILSTALLVLSDENIEKLLYKIPECDIVKINYASGHPEIKIY